MSILANGAVSDLSDVIDVYYVDPSVQVANRAALTDGNKLGTLSSVLAKLGETGSGTLEAGKSDTITIAFKMQESAGNDYMNKAIGTDFSIVLNATQLTHENDSFNNQYDADAVNPVFTAPVQRPENATEPASIGDDIITASVPAGVINNLPDTVSSYSIKYAEPIVDEENNIITFVYADVIDQDGNVIDLTNNTQLLTVRINAGDSFAAGDRVKVFHDDKEIDTLVVNDKGYIEYKVFHFCEIRVTDNIIHVSTAQELIDALTKIRTRAKEQIPGETGNKAYRENATFILEKDIVIDDSSSFMYTDSNGAPFHFYGVNGTLDFNGHTITVTSNALFSGKAYANAVLLFQYSYVIIQGNGGIIAGNKSIPVYAWANCTVDIYGGNYVTNTPDRNESAVYVNNPSALVNVYGGTYTNSAYAFNVHDNCESTPVIVLHEGITYADFLKKGEIDVTANDIANGRIVFAEGCDLEEYEENGIAMNTVVAN